MDKDQDMWEKLFHELACIKSEMKAFKLETRAELYQIKTERKNGNSAQSSNGSLRKGNKGCYIRQSRVGGNAR